MSAELTRRWDLADEPGNVAALARRAVSEWLAVQLGADERHAGLVADALLVTSELITNSVNAHASTITLDGRCTPAHLHLSVTDDGRGFPSAPLPDPAPTDTSGRGLAIVHAVAAQWGIETEGDHTVVWAQLPLDAVGI